MKIMVTGATGRLGGLILQLLAERIQPERHTGGVRTPTECDVAADVRTPLKRDVADVRSPQERLITDAQTPPGRHFAHAPTHPGQLIAGVRNPEQAARLLARGIEVRVADYDRPDTLPGGFCGINKLLLISSSHPDDGVRLEQHSRVIHAAQEAGVKHLLYTGFAFPRPGGKDVHSLTEQRIAESGMAYTFLRSGLYTDFVEVLGLWQAMASGELVTAPGEWRFNSVIREDLAQAMALVLAEDGHEGRSYELAAARTWGFTELAEVLSQHAGREVRHREDPAVQHWIYAFLAKINTGATSSDLEQLLGRQAVPLAESIKPFIRPPAELQER
ncbi:NAD(P)H-binding protein [Paenibacillus tepidiphilus]|uniref:NAD(P)H-binding protein n=1 Tax=Paenibacillus tepidiphilus TaxID=2608683 RepID=UPI00123B0D20|nr:NAD(P)H-binding protein [Paenibacillus tepidiphilus]